MLVPATVVTTPVMLSQDGAQDSEATKGIIAILTAPDGSVVAQAGDFKAFAPGGFTLFETQRRRVREALARTLIQKTCLPAIADVLDGPDAIDILNNLCDRKSYRITLIPVGYTEDELGS